MIKILEPIFARHKVTIIEFIKFSIVWASGVSIHLVTAYILTEYIWIWYLISYYVWQFFGMTNNFLWNKYKTFKKKDWKHIRQYILSLVFYTLTALWSWGIVYILTDHLKIWYILSTLITIPIVVFINFLSHKYIVFK